MRRIVCAVMKITVPKALWSAVAAATAFLPTPLAYLPNKPKAEGGSCCYRTPRRFAHSHRQRRAQGAWASVRKAKPCRTAERRTRKP